MSHYQLTASKHIPLARLKQIKKDNFTSESGGDYCPFEIEARISEIEMKQAIAFLSKVPKIEREQAITQQINAKLVQKKAFAFTIQQIKPMFTILY